MGWKAFNLFAARSGDAYLKSFPAPRPRKARDFIALLDEPYESRGKSTLEQGLYPNDNSELYIGAYDQALVLGSIPLAEEAFLEYVPAAVGHACTLFPDSPVLVVMLHSVVNLFGYAWFVNGHLSRARAGNAEDGVVVDFGKPMEFELPLFARSRIVDSERVFRGQAGEFDEAAYGEEFVMEACRPFLGCRLDQFDSWDLELELFVQR